MDGYPVWRNKSGTTRNKDVELLIQFFEFCRDREWISKNPAKKRDPVPDNEVVPYTQNEIVQIIAACDGNSSAHAIGLTVQRSA
jgi:hypothetical protein